MHSPSPPTLEFPFPEAPKLGETILVRPGLWWARMPLPFRLNHVNIWLLEDADGFTAIDSGADTPQVRAGWERLAETIFKDKPLRRIVLTHGHMDHLGAAAWLMRRLSFSELHATPLEWHSARTRLLDAQQPLTPSCLEFLRAHASADLAEADWAQDMASIRAYTWEIPDKFIRMGEDNAPGMGGRRWRLITAGGHSDAHASFHCEDDAILIAGDQILDRITPMVGVFPIEPLGDPLSEYLNSLSRFRPIPEKTLVLPSHGRPFFGLHRRLDQLQRHHDIRLNETADLIRAPVSSRDVANALFRDAMKTGHARLGLAETLSHLHRLIAEGRARRITQESGAILFQAI